MKLEVKAERKYRQPQYPAMEAVRLDPELLRKLPERWRGSAVLCMALVLSAGLAGCRKPVDNQDKAQIFPYGSGQVYFINTAGAGFASAYMDEREALQLIEELTQSKGLDFSRETLQLEGTFPAPGTKNNRHNKYTWDGTLEMDGFDPEKRVAIEFVSMKDMYEWNDQGPEVLYYSEATARNLAERLNQMQTQGAEYIGVFYDPGLTDKQGNQIKGTGRPDHGAYREEVLRQQVRDFLDWLAAEGVI